MALELIWLGIAKKPLKNLKARKVCNNAITMSEASLVFKVN